MMQLLLIAALAAGAPATPPPLTPEGWGELRIGMSEAEAVRKFRLNVPSNDDGVSSVACRELTFPEGGPDLVAMAENGRITRISLFFATARYARTAVSAWAPGKPISARPMAGASASRPTPTTKSRPTT